MVSSFIFIFFVPSIGEGIYSLVTRNNAMRREGLRQNTS